MVVIDYYQGAQISLLTLFIILNQGLMSNQQIQNTIQCYFSDQQPISQNISGYIEHTNQQILSEISQGKIKISPSKLEVKKDSTKNYYDVKMKQLKTIDQSRHKYICELNDIDSEQRKIIVQLKSKSSLKNRSRNKLERSVVGSGQKTKILKTQKSMKQYDRTLKNRIEQLNYQIKVHQTEKQQQLQIQRAEEINRIRMRKREKRNKVEEKFRTKYHTQCQKRLQDNQYRYKRNQQSDKLLQRQRDKYLRVLLKEKKSRMYTDFNQIKQHSIEHDTIIAHKKQQFRKQLQMNIIKNKKSVYHPSSIFLRKLKQEEEEVKKQQQREIQTKKNMRNRINDFQDYVNTNFRPNNNPKSKFSPPKLITEPIISNPELRFQKGNQYMIEAKKVTKKKQQIKSQRGTQTTKQPFPQNSSSEKKQYQNYMQDHLKGQKSSKSSMNKLQRLLQDKHSLCGEKADEVLWQIHKKQMLLNQQKQHRKKTKSEYILAKQKIAFLNSIIDQQ